MSIDISPADTGDITRQVGEGTQVIQPFEPDTIPARRPQAVVEPEPVEQPVAYIGRHRPDSVQVEQVVAEPEPFEPPAVAQPQRFDWLRRLFGGAR